MLMRKIQRQPAASVMKPPSGGPTVRPMYTAITLMPRARPRSCGGKTAVTIAADVAPMKAAPAPWMMRETIEPGAAHADGAQERGDREDGDAEQVVAHPAVLVREPPGRDQEHGGGQQERRRDPHGGGEAEVQVTPHDRHRDADDGAVERPHEGADGGQRQQLPAAPVEVFVGDALDQCHEWRPPSAHETHVTISSSGARERSNVLATFATSGQPRVTAMTIFCSSEPGSTSRSRPG